MTTEGVQSPTLVERSITIRAAPSEVWRAIVDPALARRWMGMRIACGWEPGSTVTLSETPLGADYTERGTLLAFEPGRLVRFDHFSPLWGVPDRPGHRAVATLRVDPADDGTRVSFRHELPDVEALAEHSDFFWRVALGNLKTLLERAA